MASPRIEINLKKIAHNSKTLLELYASKGIDVMGVTKVVCGNPDIARVLINSGINMLADSRISNIRRMRDAGIRAQFILLRTPAPSQAEEVVKYADISLNSELAVIKLLSDYAIKSNFKHKIILMVELGDLREGIMPEDLDFSVQQVLEMGGVELAGIGTNLACFGGIKPDKEKMDYFSSLAEHIEEKFDMKLALVSGGNSANYNWFSSAEDAGRINNLRLGESIYLGCETLHRNPVPGLFADAFKLIAEVIESKVKPSLPYGEIAQDAFGNVPGFTDIGQINRSILNVGLQDVLVSGLTPCRDMEIIGSSSDHVLINSKQEGLIAGNEVEFYLDYGSLLSAMTSQYITKNIII